MPDNERDEIEARVLCALSMLVERDRHLLDVDVHERSITTHLREYLGKLFPEWNVDGEYNRHGDDIKRLKEFYRNCTGVESPKDSDVVPDIIVHKRGKPCNLLVVEVKKTTSKGSNKADICKLKAFKKDPRFSYSHALFLKIRVGDESEHPWELCWI